LKRGVSFFKGTHATQGKAREWWIYDLDGSMVRRVERLTDEEKKYPILERVDDVLMVRLVDERWSPEKDPRI